MQLCADRYRLILKNTLIARLYKLEQPSTPYKIKSQCRYDIDQNNLM